jgi:titin
VVRGTAGDKYEIQNGSLTKLHNVELTLGACTDSVSGNDVTVAQHSCAPRLKVVKLPQTVTFEQPEPRKVGKSALTASASSELAAGFTSSTTDVCTVSGTTLTVLTEGECKITAVQAGNGVYGSASSEERTIEILPRPPAPPTVEGTAGTSSITVTWTAPQETGAITDYVAAARSGDYVTSCVSTQMTCVLGAVAGRPYSLTVVSRGPNGVSKVTEGAETVTASAPEVPSAPPPTNLVLTTTDGKITTAEPGQEITFIGTGFARFSTVTITIYSEPVILGTAVTDGAGAFRKPITVPASLAAGAHSAVAQGVAPDGSPRAMALAITVAESLPQTGPALGAMLLAGFGAVLGGVVLMMAGRPRRRVLR